MKGYLSMLVVLYTAVSMCGAAPQAVRALKEKIDRAKSDTVKNKTTIQEILQTSTVKKEIQEDLSDLLDTLDRLQWARDEAFAKKLIELRAHSDAEAIIWLGGHLRTLYPHEHFPLMHLMCDLKQEYDLLDKGVAQLLSMVSKKHDNHGPSRAAIQHGLDNVTRLKHTLIHVLTVVNDLLCRQVI